MLRQGSEHDGARVRVEALAVCPARLTTRHFIVAPGQSWSNFVVVTTLWFIARAGQKPVVLEFDAARERRFASVRSICARREVGSLTAAGLLIGLRVVFYRSRNCDNGPRNLPQLRQVTGASSHAAMG